MVHGDKRKVMKMKTLLAALGISAVAIGVAVTTTSAIAVQYTYQGETGGLVIELNTVIPGYTDASFAVGQFDMTTSDSGWITPLYTYCTDVGTLLSSTHAYTPLSFTDPLSTGVNPLWVSGGIQNAAKLWYAYNDAASTAAQKAGLQLAIWEALYNSKSSYADSDFFSSANNGFYVRSSDTGNVGSAVDYAVAVLNNLSTLSSAPNGTWLAPVLANGSIGGSQGLFYPLPPPPSVPDAAFSLTLLGIAITALGIAGRKLRG
jgi:hypothetical protein